MELWLIHVTNVIYMANQNGAWNLTKMSHIYTFTYGIGLLQMELPNPVLS